MKIRKTNKSCHFFKSFWDTSLITQFQMYKMKIHGPTCSKIASKMISTISPKVFLSMYELQNSGGKDASKYI